MADNKDRFVGVRMCDDELAALDRRRAELAGEGRKALSRSDYIRLLLAADAQRGPDERPQACPVNPLFWHAVVVQIRRIGTNLNQAVASYRRLTREDDRATLILDSSLVNSLRVARESLASLAEECAGVHERAGVKVSHSYARALMRQAAQAAPEPGERA